MVSQGDARRSLFGRSFDVHRERLIEMYHHHHHEQHIVSGIPAHDRRPPPSTGPGLSATYLHLTFRHAGVYPRDRKCSNFSRSIHRVAALNISPVPLRRHADSTNPCPSNVCSYHAHHHRLRFLPHRLCRFVPQRAIRNTMPRS